MKLKSFFLLASIALLSVSTFYSCDDNCDDGGFRDHTFDKPSWAGNLQEIIPMGSVRLNNYTSSSGRYCRYAADPGCQTAQNTNPDLFCPGAEFQFKHPCDSEIDFLIGARTFDIEVPRVGPDNMLRIYINDVNSNRLNADARDSRLIIGIDFESKGWEIIGACHENLACFAGVPEFNLDDMHVDLSFNLEAVDGQITYSDVEVSIDADFENAGMCRDNVFAFLCGDSRSLVFGNLTSQIRATLMQEDTKRFISQTLHNHIVTTLNLGSRSIRRASILGDQLVLNLECE